MVRVFGMMLLCMGLLNADYLLKQSYRAKSRIDLMPKNKVADMKMIPQDPAHYADQIKPFLPQEQQKHDREFNQRYFYPWELNNLDIPEEDFGWEERFVTKKPIYTEKGEMIPHSIYGQWLKNANMANVDTKKYKAITVRHTEVKALPTSKSFYRDPRKVGEGFPFDYNQNSAYHINTPLYISHFSKDKKWAFVRGAYTFGWVKLNDIALVDKTFIEVFKNGKYAMAIKDNLRLYRNNTQVTIVKLGSLFPAAKDNQRYLIAARDKRGRARIEKVSMQDPSILAKKPLAFTPQNVAMLAKEFYGEPYGWGGGYECRDCSATTRDFLGVFGIFLERNSNKQAKEGKSISIAGLQKSLKKKKIINEAEPFRSLLYVPGHIVLYLGQYKGEPVIMHTYWGMRKNDGSKLITGRTIITSTEPGKERADIREQSKLINTLQTIVRF